MRRTTGQADVTMLGRTSFQNPALIITDLHMQT
jgi:hypothetical protein